MGRVTSFQALNKMYKGISEGGVEPGAHPPEYGHVANVNAGLRKLSQGVFSV